MHLLMFLVMGASLAQCMVLSHAETEFNELDSRSAEQHDDADWAFATLDEAYDPDDPAIKDLPEIDPSEIMFTDYDAEMDANSDGNSTGLTSRGLTHHFCGLSNYQRPTVGPIRDGIKYLHHAGNKKFCVAKKKCGRISCSYGTGFNVCNGKAKTQCYTLGGIGKRVDFLTHHVCGIHTACETPAFPWQSCSPRCCSKKARAFQGFYGGNFNIIVRGGFSC